jgi:ABC-2 type transport system ATP-binding protein
VTGEYREHRIEEVVKKIHLEGVFDQPIETLSKGFKRRVGMAQAILHDPDVLIMDEPTDGLDPNQKHEVRSLIQAMAKEKAIIISTHILEEVDAVCDRAIIISRGRVLFNGTPRELISQSKYHNAIGLQIKTAHVDEANRLLAILPSVNRIEVESEAMGMTKLLIVPNDGMSIIATVGDIVHDSGWEVGEIRVEAGRIDEVFRAVTTQTNTVAEQEHLS